LAIVVFPTPAVPVSRRLGISSCAINPDAVTKAIKQIKGKTNGKE